jgi:hypothetical protein
LSVPEEPSQGHHGNREQSKGKFQKKSQWENGMGRKEGGMLKRGMKETVKIES